MGENDEIKLYESHTAVCNANWQMPTNMCNSFFASFHTAMLLHTSKAHAALRECVGRGVLSNFVNEGLYCTCSKCLHVPILARAFTWLAEQETTPCPRLKEHQDV